VIDHARPFIKNNDYNTQRKKQTQAESNYKENGPSKTKKKTIFVFSSKEDAKKGSG
jgi:hypothetical protein